MGKEEQLLSISIIDSIHQASRYVDKISYISEGLRTADEAERENPGDG